MDKRVYAKGLINLDERAEFRILILDVNFIVLLKPECGLGPWHRDIRNSDVISDSPANIIFFFEIEVYHMDSFG